VNPPGDVFRCAEAARERHDPLIGSAPRTDQWLLIEHPGPWRVDALAGSGIAESVLTALSAAAQRTSTRVLLIRRPGRHVRTAPRRWILSGLDATTQQGHWDSDDELLAAVDAMSRRLPETVQDPLILVCTHGVHDTCCALRGRPVAAALAAQWPDAVWECSHVGGDRFAPTVVVLPDGFYYGNLDPGAALDVVRQHLSGKVPVDYLRGTARHAPPVQAAVCAAYEQCGPLRPGDVTVRDVRRDGPHDGHGARTTVLLDVAGRPQPIRVEVLSVRRAEAQLTCRASRATPATEYRVQHVDPAE
jgi:hypothetical protein